VADPLKRLWKLLSQNQFLAALIAGLLVVGIVGLVHVLTSNANSRPTGGSTGSPIPHTSTPTTSPSPTASPSSSLPQAQSVTVPLGELCNEPNTNDPDIADGSCKVDNGAASIGSRLFTWAAMAVTPGQTRQQVLSFPGPTTCTQLTLQFGFSTDSGTQVPGLMITITVEQTSGSAELSVANDQLRTLTVRLDGGPWQIYIAANQSSPQVIDMPVYMNGSAVCSTSTGEP